MRCLIPHNKVWVKEKATICLIYCNQNKISISRVGLLLCRNQILSCYVSKKYQLRRKSNEYFNCQRNHGVAFFILLVCFAILHSSLDAPITSSVKEKKVIVFPFYDPYYIRGGRMVNGNFQFQIWLLVRLIALQMPTMQLNFSKTSGSTSSTTYVLRV